MSVCESEHAEGGSHYLEQYRKSIESLERESMIWWNELVSLETDRFRGEKLNGCGVGRHKKVCCAFPEDRDSEGVEHDKKYVPFRCKDDLCSVCGDKRVAERARSAWMRMKGTAGKWWHITFTIPSESKAQIKEADSDLKLTAKATKRAIEEVVGGRIGGLYARHTFSSKAIWREFYHVHDLFSCKVITKSGGVKNWKWFEKEEIRKLKELYVKYVLEETGVEFGKCRTRDGLPVVHVKYRSRGRVRRHTLKYVLRNAVMFDKIGYDGEDVWLDVGGKEGQVIVDRQTFKGVFRHYVKGRHHAVWWGFLAYNAGKRYYVLVGKGEFKVARVSDTWDVCSVCGASMVVWEVIDCGYDLRKDEMGCPL